MSNEELFSPECSLMKTRFLIVIYPAGRFVCFTSVTCNGIYSIYKNNLVLQGTTYFQTSLTCLGIKHTATWSDLHDSNVKQPQERSKYKEENTDIQEMIWFTSGTAHKIYLRKFNDHPYNWINQCSIFVLVSAYGYTVLYSMEILCFIKMRQLLFSWSFDVFPPYLCLLCSSLPESLALTRLLLT